MSAAIVLCRRPLPETNFSFHGKLSLRCFGNGRKGGGLGVAGGVRGATQRGVSLGFPKRRGRGLREVRKLPTITIPCSSLALESRVGLKSFLFPPLLVPLYGCCPSGSLLNSKTVSSSASVYTSFAFPPGATGKNVLSCTRPIRFYSPRPCFTSPKKWKGEVRAVKWDSETHAWFPTLQTVKRRGGGGDKERIEVNISIPRRSPSSLF